MILDYCCQKVSGGSLVDESRQEPAWGEREVCEHRNVEKAPVFIRARREGTLVLEITVRSPRHGTHEGQERLPVTNLRAVLSMATARMAGTHPGEGVALVPRPKGFDNVIDTATG